MKKRFLASLLAVVMVLAMLPTAAGAADKGEGNGMGKDNAWDISADDSTSEVYAYLTENEGNDGTYTLTVTGTGAVKDFSQAGDYATANSPWKDYNDSITKIVVGDEVTRLGNYTFGNMRQVTDLSIGAGLTEYGNWALIQMTSLDTITVGDKNASFKIGTDGALYSTDGKTLYLYPQGRIAPNTNYTVPDGVTTIHKGAFRGAEKIVSINLNQVTTIEDQGFLGTGITEINVPSTVTSMGTGVFRCPNLETAVYDASTTLATQTFLGCTNLKTVTIGEHVTGTGNTPFSGCSALETVYFNAKKVEDPEGTAPYWFSGCDATNVTVYVEDKCQYIPTNFAREFSGITAVIFESGTTPVTIGDRAFLESSGLNTLADESGRISEIGAQAFKNTNLSGALTLGSGVTSIGMGAFMGTSLTELTIVGTESGVEILSENDDNGAFSGIETLQTVRLGSHITKIGRGTFRGCSNLVAVDLSQATKLATIEWRYAFYGLAQNSTIYVSDSTVAGLFNTKDDSVYDKEKTALAITNGGTVTVDSTKTGFDSVVMEDHYATWHEGTTAEGTETKDETPRAGKTYFANWTVCTHENLNYSATGSTLTQTCSKCGHTATATISAPANLTVDGRAKEATVAYSDGWIGEKNLEITYYSGSTALASAPTTAGAYTAQITAGGETAAVTFTLTNYVAPSTPSSGSSDPSYSPVMDVTGNGDVRVNPRTPSEGDEVTITVDPERGYEVDEVIVRDRNGNQVDVTAERNGTYTFEQPRGRVTIEVTFVPTGSNTFFTDVPASFWAYDEIEWAYENGYVNGTTTTTFSPNASISRQQVWMILARMSGQSPANMAEARQWAIDNGISDGTTPGNAVTRQQLVALLYRYATLMGYANDARADLSIYPDADTVASYAAEPMQWSVGNGIVAGTSAGTLNPTGTATRTQFAVILYRFMNQG